MKKKFILESKGNYKIRLDPDILISKLRKYKIISFDVFDTLILRKFNSPNTLFVILGEELGVYNFYTLRKQAEDHARKDKFQKCGHEEVSLDDIYQNISNKMGIDVSNWAEKEFNLECQYCQANPYMKYVVEKLYNEDCTMVITSDMYLSKSQIEYLLQLTGYTKFNYYFVSSELGVSKKNRGIFEKIIDHYDTKDIIHVGNHKKFDFENCEAAGLKSFHYESVQEYSEKQNADKMSYLTKNLYAGIINNHLYNGLCNYDSAYKIGFIYGGIYILGFANWINNMAKKDGVEKIIFLSRDGDIYSQVYDKIPQKLPWTYFHWSRFAGMKILAKNNFYEFCQRMIYHKAKPSYNVSIENYLSTMGLDFLIGKLEYYGIKEEEKLNLKNAPIVEKIFLSNYIQIMNSYQEDIVSTYEQVRLLVAGSGKVAIVDVGWAGTGPLILKRIIQESMGKNYEVECYLAACRNRLVEIQSCYLMKSDIKAYLFTEMYNKEHHDYHLESNHGLNSLLFEVFTQSCNPSFLQYTKNGMVFAENDESNYKTIKQVQDGILHFCDLYLAAFKSKPYLLNITGYDAYLPFKKLSSNLIFYKEIFGGYVFTNGIFKNEKRMELKNYIDAVEK